MKKMFLASSFQEVAHVLADWEKTLRGKTVTFIQRQAGWSGSRSMYPRGNKRLNN